MITNHNLTNCLALAGIALLLGGCVSNPPSKNTIRICDDTGCSERPTSTATADYLNKSPNIKSEQILRLEQKAEKDAQAAYDLAQRYLHGDGVPRNTHQYIQWMRKAGEKGLLKAQKTLGYFYLNGFGEMGRDPVEAKKWLSMAAAQETKEPTTQLTSTTKVSKHHQTATNSNDKPVQPQRNEQTLVKNNQSSLEHEIITLDEPTFSQTTQKTSNPVLEQSDQSSSQIIIVDSTEDIQRARANQQTPTPRQHEAIQQDSVVCTSHLAFKKQIDLLSDGIKALAPNCFITLSSQPATLLDFSWSGTCVVRRHSDQKKLWTFCEFYKG